MKKILLLTLLSIPIFQPKATNFQDSTRNKNSKILHFFTGNKYLVAPFTFYMPETNWVFGAGVKRFFNAGGEGDSLTRVSNTAIFLQYSLNNQIMFEHNYQIFTKKEKYYFVGNYGYSKFPILYYGVGSEAKSSNEEAVTFEQIRFDNLSYRKIGGHSFAGLGWRYVNMYNVKGSGNGVLENSNIPGKDGSSVSGLNISYQYDTRDNVLTTSRGDFAQIIYSIHNQLTGSSHNFQRWQIDLRKFYRPFRHRKDVIAFQTYGYLTSGDVPFNELGLLGGDMIMRGYYIGSLRDNNLMAVQAEYRWQALKRWGLVGFAGFGSINKSFQEIRFDKILPSFGGGIRFKINRKENVNVRIDYGFGNGQQNLYFFIAEAF
jgi:hypothetical protein